MARIAYCLLFWSVFHEVYTQTPASPYSFGPRWGMGFEWYEQARSWAGEKESGAHAFRGKGIETFLEYHYRETMGVRLGYRYGNNVQVDDPSWQVNWATAHLRSGETESTGHLMTFGHQWSTETRLRPLVGVDLLLGFIDNRIMRRLEYHHLDQPGNIDGGTVMLDGSTIHTRDRSINYGATAAIGVQFALRQNIVMQARFNSGYVWTEPLDGPVKPYMQFIPWTDIGTGIYLIVRV